MIALVRRLATHQALNGNIAAAGLTIEVGPDGTGRMSRAGWVVVVRHWGRRAGSWGRVQRTTLEARHIDFGRISALVFRPSLCGFFVDVPPRRKWLSHQPRGALLLSRPSRVSPRLQELEGRARGVVPPPFVVDAAIHSPGFRGGAPALHHIDPDCVGVRTVFCDVSGAAMVAEPSSYTYPVSPSLSGLASQLASAHWC